MFKSGNQPRFVRALASLAMAWACLTLGGCDDGPADPADAAPDALGCPAGFFAGADGCVDINECRGDSPPCDALTECINLSGGFTCSVCPPGFEGDGVSGCVCPDGQHPGGEGRCVPAGTCAPRFVLDDEGGCVPCAGAECPALVCPDDDEAEPDDSADEAGPVDGRLRIACADDDDVVRLDPGAACRVTVVLSPAAAGLAVVVADGAGQEVGRGAVEGGDLVARAELAAGAGPFVAVVFVAGVSGEGAIYRIASGYDGHDGGDGACVDRGVCSAGFRLQGEDCVPVAGCGEGEHDGGDGECVAVGTCSAGFHDGGDGVCVAEGMCAAGFHDGGDGECVVRGTCAAGFHDGGDGVCVGVGMCRPGFVDGGDGRCVPGGCSPGFHDGGDGECVPVGACSAGFRDDGAGRCVGLGAGCAAGFHEGGAGECAAVGFCAPGFALDLRDACRAVAECGAGERDDGTGRCTGVGGGCAFGYHPGGGDPGACVPAGDCSPGFVDRGDGRCGPPFMCLAGFVADGDGRCVGDLDCPADDRFEPSDAERPARIGAGQTVLGVLCAGDVDVYRLDAVPCAGRVLLRHDADEGDLTLTVVSEADPAGEQVAATGSDDERLSIAGAGPWRIEVSGGASRYALRVDLDGHDGGEGSCQPRGACAEAFTLDDEAACTLCAAGFQPGGGGACTAVGTCAAGYHDGNGIDPGTLCVPDDRCSRGYHDGGNGACRPEGVCDPPASDRGDGICAPADAPCVGGRARVGGFCVCRPGTEDGGDGVCVVVGQCSPGYQDDGRGLCTPLALCASDHHYTPWGDCRATEPACGQGERDDGAGRCSPVCAAGFREGGDGLCIAAPACGPEHVDDGFGRCVAVGRCAAGQRPVDGRCLPVIECPGPGTDDLDNAPALAIGGRGEGVICAPAVDVWRLDLPAGCGAVVRLSFDAARIDLDLELLDGAGLPIAATASLGPEERLVLPSGSARTAFARVRPYPPEAASSAVYRIELLRDALRCPGACAAPLRADGAGRCVGRGEACAAGFRDGGGGICVPLDRCAPGFHDDGFGGCVPFDVCGPGAIFGLDGICRPEVECALLRDDGTGICAVLNCAAGFREGGGGLCQAPPACSTGYADNGAGECVRRVGGAGCAPGFVANADALCLAGGCPEGDDTGDTLATARRVAVDGYTRLDGAVCGDDVDYFRVELFRGCTLDAHLRFDHAEGDLALGFLGAGGGRFGPIADTTTDDETSGHTALADGPVWVAVEPVGAPSVRYRLDLRVSCPD